MERDMLFGILCGMLAAKGSDVELLGGSVDVVREAFCRMTPDGNLIHAYFEMPLLGAPGLDVHCAVTHEQVAAGVDAQLDDAWGDTLRWFKRTGPFQTTSGEVFIMAEADTSTGERAQSGMYLIQGEREDLVAPFLDVVGESGKISAWKMFVRRLPVGWETTYTGVFPGRGDKLLRVNARPSSVESTNVCKAWDALGIDYDDGVINLCRELMSCAQRLDVQLDVDESGCPQNAFGLEFSLQDGGEGCAFADDGPGTRAMRVLESRGLADERWRLAADACLSRRIKLPGASGLETCCVSVRPFSVKVKIQDRSPLPAKLYLRGDASFGDTPRRPTPPVRARGE